MPDHVQLSPAPRIRIRVAGQVIVDTAAGYIVHEGGLPPRYYVPPADVHAELSDGEGGARCPWKGLWKHVDVTAGGQRIASAAWTYYDTTPVCAPLRGFLAFYPNKVEAIDVG